MKKTKKNFIFWKNTKAVLRQKMKDNNFDSETVKEYGAADKNEGKAYAKYLYDK